MSQRKCDIQVTKPEQSSCAVKTKKGQAQVGWEQPALWFWLPKPAQGKASSASSALWGHTGLHWDVAHWRNTRTQLRQTTGSTSKPQPCCPGFPKIFTLGREQHLNLSEIPWSLPAPKGNSNSGCWPPKNPLFSSFNCPGVTPRFS